MINVFRKIWRFAKSEHKHLAISLTFNMLSAVLQALQFLAVYFAINDIVNGTVNNSTIGVCAAILISTCIIQMVTKYFDQLNSVHAGFFMVANKRIELGNTLKNVSMGYFNKQNLGDITGVSTTILGDLEMGASQVLVMVLSGLINTFVFSIVVLIFDWRIGLWAILFIVLYLLSVSLTNVLSKNKMKDRQEAQKNLVSATLETIQGMNVVKTFNLEGKNNEKITTAINESCKRNLANETYLTPTMLLKDIILDVAIAGLIGLTIVFSLNGTMSLVNSLIMLIIAFSFFTGLRQTGSTAVALRMVENSLDRANELNNMPLMEEKETGEHIKSHDITFENVNFSYENKNILKDINLQIKENTMNAIVGPSGSGKTTICNLIARLWDVDSGSIKIGGVDIRNITLNELMSNISMVFQNIYLFQDTIENNIKFGLNEATHEEVVDAAKRAQAHDFIMQLPNGYDTVIGEAGASLSGGEKQRISIARAMLKDAPIIILDEATSNVDPENENKLQSAFKSLTKDKTVIIIAHRLKTIRDANQILVVNNGEIVERGTDKELRKNNGVYNTLIKAREKAHGWKISI